MPVLVNMYPGYWWWWGEGRARRGEGGPPPPGGVGELLKEAGFEPGGVIEPNGDDEEYIVLLDIRAGGEPAGKYIFFQFFTQKLKTKLKKQP